MRILPLLFALCLSLNSFGQVNIKALSKVVKTHHDAAFSGVVAVWDSSGEFSIAAAGFADQTTSLQMDAEQVFRIGYLTELFTTVCILQLVERGNIGLDSKLSELIPESGVLGGEDISISHLLTHTSGVPVVDSIPDDRKTPNRMVYSHISDAKAYGKVGRYRHSMLDYILLGMVAEKFNMKSWQYLVEDDVVRHLSLTATDEHERGQLIDGMATGYTTTPDGTLTPEPRYRVGNLGAAGCMYSTAADLFTFHQAFCAGHFFNVALLDELDAFASQKNKDYPGMRVRSSHMKGFTCHIEPGLLVLANSDRDLTGLVGDARASQK